MKQTLLDAGFSVYEAIIIEWQFEYSGGFQTKLMQLIAIADMENRDRLVSEFPNEVLAFAMFSEESGWWQDVEERFIKEFKTKEVK